MGEGFWRWRCALGCTPGQCGHGAHCRNNGSVCTYDSKAISEVIPISQQNGSQALAVASQEQSRATRRHYGDPKMGCRLDEVALRVDGLMGAVCSPACSKQGNCPTDVPRGVTAQPSCSFILRGERFCALKCRPGQCGACPGTRKRWGDEKNKK